MVDVCLCDCEEIDVDLDAAIRGRAGTVTVGEVTSNFHAEVTNVGTKTDAILNFDFSMDFPNEIFWSSTNW